MERSWPGCRSGRLAATPLPARLAAPYSPVSMSNAAFPHRHLLGIEGMAPSEIYLLLDAAEAYGRAPLGYRNNGSRVIDTPEIQPLRAEVDDFIACIATGCEPQSSLAAARRVMVAVEACQQSAAREGTFVPVSPEGFRP